MPAPAEEFRGVFVSFARDLRARGLDVGTGQISRYMAAIADLGVSSLTDVYWAGRTTLVSRRSDGAVYDHEFLRFFLGPDGPLGTARDDEGIPQPPGAEAAPDDATTRSIDRSTDTADAAEDDDSQEAGARAAHEEVLRVRSFSDWTSDELALLGRLIAQIRIRAPMRLARRLRRSPIGDRLDLRQTVRQSLRHEGEAIRRAWKRRKRRPRPIIMLIDVSGSMAAHSRALLHLAYVVCHGGVRAEVFCFGTRLTRVTPLLADRDPNIAVAMAASAVTDWDGGTRIGDSLQTFLRVWGRQNIIRGSLLLIFSDGLERGEPEVLEAAMARLARLTHRIVWLNPLKADPDYEPLVRGMRAALPHIDRFVAADSLSDLEAVGALIPLLV
jgi:uncharacterized protein with von Willebrand factor type A (vWA) domain